MKSLVGWLDAIFQMARQAGNVQKNWLLKWVSYCPVRCKMAAGPRMPPYGRGLASRLIGKAREAFLPPQYRQNIENSR